MKTAFRLLISAMFALARYRPDGSLDMGFGTDGRITTDFGNGDSRAYAVMLPSDGRIVATGHSFTGASFNFALAAYQVGGSPMEVTIDIKPGSRTNHVNPKSRERIHAAILSTPEFDALTMIDRTTIRFGRTGEEESLHSCKEKGRDVNHDGLKDLVCVFSIRGSGFQQGDEIGILTAQTVDGVAIIGQDSIRVTRGTMMIDQDAVTSIKRVLVEESRAAFRDPFCFLCFIVVLCTTWFHF